MSKFISNLDLTAKGSWLTDTVGILVLLIVLFMPKQLRWREIFFIWMTIGFMGWMNNTLVAVLLNLHDIGDPNKRGLPEIINYTIIPPSLSIIFLNYFNPSKKWLYSVTFTVLSLVYEWGLVQVGMMKLKGWHVWYSIPVFLVMYGLVIPWILRYIRKENAGNDGSDHEFNLNLGREKAR